MKNNKYQIFSLEKLSKLDINNFDKSFWENVKNNNSLISYDAAKALLCESEDGNPLLKEPSVVGELITNLFPINETDYLIPLSPKQNQYFTKYRYEIRNVFNSEVVHNIEEDSIIKEQASILNSINNIPTSVNKQYAGKFTYGSAALLLSTAAYVIYNEIAGIIPTTATVIMSLAAAYTMEKLFSSRNNEAQDLSHNANLSI